MTSTENQRSPSRTLVVSGASRGHRPGDRIAAATQGANMVLLAKTAEPHPKLQGTVYTAVEEIEAAGGKAAAVVGDVRKEEDILRAVDTAVERFGGDRHLREQRQRHRPRAPRNCPPRSSI